MTFSLLELIEKGMTKVKLKANEWGKIRTFLDETPEVYVGREKRCRKFVEGVVWILRSGSQWRLLPKQYGKWNSVYKRFDRWSEQGVWEKMFEHFADDPDMESLLLDSSVIRAHSCSAGAPHKKGDKRRKLSAIVEAGSAPRYTSPSMLWATPCACS